MVGIKKSRNLNSTVGVVFFSVQFFLAAGSSVIRNGSWENDASQFSIRLPVFRKTIFGFSVIHAAAHWWPLRLSHVDCVCAHVCLSDALAVAS